MQMRGKEAFGLGSRGSCESWLDIVYISRKQLKGFADKLNVECETENQGRFLLNGVFIYKD